MTTTAATTPKMLDRKKSPRRSVPRRILYPSSHWSLDVPSAIMSRILSAGDTFVAGAKQHDDMTLVVIRVES